MPRDPGWLRTPLSVVALRSDPALAKAVQAHCVPYAKTLVPVPCLNGRKTLRVRSSDLLRELGRASSPPNLRRGAFNATSQWAWVRYRWAFGRNPKRRLTVTPEALRLRYHHSTVFSEHVGIAFGLDVARKVLRRSHPGASITFHDVDFVLDGIALAGAQVTTGRKRPDYIAQVQEPSGRVTYYAVECKGRRSHKPDYMAVQLATGASQVQYLRIGGTGLPSLVIGTSAGPQGVHVYVLDPEDEGLSHQALERVAPAPRPRVTETDQGQDIEPADFVARIAAAASAEVLLNAGLYDEAGELLEEEVEAGDSSVSRTLGNQAFTGELLTLPVNGVAMTFFRGVLTGAVERARSRSTTTPPVQDLHAERPLDLDEEAEEDFEPDDEANLSDLEGVTAVDDSGFTVGAWYGTG